MKKIAMVLALVSALAAARMIYPATMQITNIDRETDRVEMVTASGLIYAMDGTEDYDVGDLVSVLMFDNGTPRNVRDDIIVDARYAGVFNG